MLRSRVALSLIVALGLAVGAFAADAGDGSPFGRTTEVDGRRFLALAKSSGVDVEADYKRAEAGDSNALGRIFSVATQFSKMNGPARVYGNLLFSCFLNLVETRGEEFFAGALARQPGEVRQRVRDFVFYATKQTPEPHRAEVERQTREQFPKIFPETYVFGRRNDLF